MPLRSGHLSTALALAVACASPSAAADLSAERWTPDELAALQAIDFRWNEPPVGASGAGASADGYAAAVEAGAPTGSPSTAVDVP